MDEYVWTFGRRDERFQIRRENPDEGRQLTVAGPDGTRTYRFDDPEQLAPIHRDIETFLLRTGWSLLEFSPERRTGRDRRHTPRLRERRRWWTDALLGPQFERPRRRR